MIVTESMIKQHLGKVIYDVYPVSSNSNDFIVAPNDFFVFVMKRKLFNDNKIYHVFGIYPKENQTGITFFIPILVMDYDDKVLIPDIKRYYNDVSNTISFNNDNITVEISYAKQVITKSYEFHYENIVFMNKYIVGIHWLTFLKDMGTVVFDERS